MKRCSKCQIVYSNDMFKLSPRTGEHRSVCNMCVRRSNAEHNRQYRARHKEVINARLAVKRAASKVAAQV